MAGRGQGTSKSFGPAKVTYLHIAATNDSWGGQDDRLSTEVVFQIEESTRAFGFELHAGDKELPNALAMLSLLRHAYFNSELIGGKYWLEDNDESNKTGFVYRVGVGEARYG